MAVNSSVAAIDVPRLQRQCDILLDRLKRGPVTNVEAMRDMNIFNLSARVSELRQEGWDIRAARINRGLFEYRLIPRVEI